MSDNRYVKVKLVNNTDNGTLGLGEFEIDKQTDVLSVGKGSFPTGDIVVMSDKEEREVRM